MKPPIWKSENEHGWHVSHCASEAAIFMTSVGLVATTDFTGSINCDTIELSLVGHGTPERTYLME